MPQNQNHHNNDAVTRLRTSQSAQRSAARARRSVPKTDLLHADVSHEPVSRRTFVLAFLGVAGAVCGFQLGRYQVFGDDRAENELYWRRVYNQTLYAKRGTIYDRNGNVLTSSESCYDIAVNPSQVDNKNKVVRALMDVLDVDEKTCNAAVNGNSYAYIQRKVDTEEGKKLEKYGLAGIVLEPSMKRVYPFGSACAQLLGVTDTEHNGISGLELQYEDTLMGTNGSIVREHAADGSYVAGGAYKKVAAKDGADIVLTIDVNIQQAAEEALAEAVERANANYGSIIVSDPRTGDIFAACSYPTYNPSDLSTARAEDMNLRVVTDAYEPGSVFKTFVCGMSIEEGIAGPDTTYEVPSTVKAGDDDVYDSDLRDYAMTMTMREILRRSSNTGMVLVGKQVGADLFAKYIHKFGFGKKVGVDFPGESLGIVKDRDEYDGASVAAMSFGQAISLSPVSVLHGMSAIANKGVMTVPHFLKSCGGEEKDWSAKEKRVFSKETVRQIADMMKTVVDEGTGTLGQVPGYDVSGKTGTAQRASEDGGYQKDVYMSSFIGFAPTNDPQVMVYVTLDGTPYISTAAATPFATVMESALTILDIRPTS